MKGQVEKYVGGADSLHKKPAQISRLSRDRVYYGARNPPFQRQTNQLYSVHSIYHFMHENPAMFERKQERTFRADEPKSLEAFLHAWKRYICAIIRRKGIPTNETEDVFQEV